MNSIESKEFGFIDLKLFKKLNEKNFSIRAQGILELETIVRDLSDSEFDEISVFIPSFVEFTCSLLDDPILDISYTTFSILAALIENHGAKMDSTVNILTTKLFEKWADPKLVIRRASSSILSKLIKFTVTPEKMVNIILQTLRSQNWHVKEEIVNFIIFCLLQYPVSKYDYSSIVDCVLDTLKDIRVRVKFVSIECLAVVHHNIKDEILPYLNILKESNTKQYELLLKRFSKSILPNLSKMDGVVEHKILKRVGTASDKRGKIRPVISTRMRKNYGYRDRIPSAPSVLDRSSQQNRSIFGNNDDRVPKYMGGQSERGNLYVGRIRNRRRNFPHRYGANLAQNSWDDDVDAPNPSLDDSKSNSGGGNKKNKPIWLSEMESESSTQKKHKIKTSRLKETVVQKSGDIDILSIIHKSRKNNNKIGVDRLRRIQRRRGRNIHHSYENRTDFQDPVKTPDHEDPDENGSEGNARNAGSNDPPISPAHSTKSMPSSYRFRPRQERRRERSRSYRSNITPIKQLSVYDLKESFEPEKEFDKAMRGLTSENWILQFHGITSIRRLVRYHVDVIDNTLHQVCIVVSKYVNNLRSQLAKNAIICINEMFGVFGKRLDRSLKKVYPMLLRRTSIANNFISKEAERALFKMVECSTEERSVTILIKFATNKSPSIRIVSGKLLNECLNKAKRRIFKFKDLGAFLKCTVRLLNDRSTDARWSGQMISYNFFKVFVLSFEKGEKMEMFLRKFLRDSEVKDFMEGKRRGELKNKNAENINLEGDDCNTTSLSTTQSSATSTLSRLSRLRRVRRSPKRRNKKNDQKYSSLSKNILITKKVENY